MKTMQKIRQQVSRTPAGTPFTVKSLLGLGSRAAVDQALSRLVKAGRIRRVARGVYVRPLESRHVGAVVPAPSQIAEAVAKGEHAKLQVHGAEAARQLGLTTQMSGKPVYLTTGTGRRLQVGRLEVRLVHTGHRAMTLAGHPAGTALSALRYLGKGQVTPATIETIRRKLATKEFAKLRKATHAMPAWLIDVFHQHRKEFEHGGELPTAA